MIIEIGNFQIRPYDNHLCWEIWQYRDVKTRDGSEKKAWMSENCYPQNLEQALLKVRERLMKANNAKNAQDITSLDCAIDELRRTNNQLIKAIKVVSA